MSASTPQYTKQQQRAIDTKHVSVALAAGAGCGKTFVLTHRFLSYLDPEGAEDPLSKIVAITFTERAAREMRYRIREACLQQLKNCEQKHVDYWLKIMRGLETARITTIHSFCSSFLRSHAVDAGLDPQFGLMEPDFADPLLLRLVSETVHHLLEQQDADCRRLVLDFGLERTCQIIKTMVEHRFQIETHTYEAQETEATVEQWKEYVQKVFLPRLLEELLSHPATDRTLELMQQNSCGAPKMEERRLQIASLIPQLPEFPEPIEAVTQLHELLNLRGVRKTHWETEEIHEEVKQSFKAIKTEIEKFLEIKPLLEEPLEPAVEVGRRVYHVAEQAATAYEEYKQEQGLLDFDDLLLLTRKLLRDSEPLRQRAAAGIDYLMVDEFQDTDPIQTDVVRYLCSQHLLTGKLFLVGDVKQSIYRFRRADPDVFVSLRQDIPPEGRLPLSTNFRSQPEILRFVNVLFHDEVEEDYEPLQPFSEQQLTPKPAIEFLWTDPQRWEEGGGVNQRRVKEAETIALRIQQLLEDETPRVRDKDPETGQTILRRTQPGDIVILFRAMTNVGLYEEALRSAGLSYYLVGGRAFYTQQEVFDFVNVCQFLDDPTDEISLVGILRSPFFGLSDDSIFALKQLNADSLYTAIQQELPSFLSEEQQQQIRHAGRVLSTMRANKDRWSLVELFRYLLDQTGYDASLLHEFMGRRKVANLRKLIDMARQFDRSGLYTLTDFVARLKTSIKGEAKEELATTHPETSDVIRLMTVHQSKGLEFPIVIVADTCWTQRTNPEAVSFHPHLGPLAKPPKKRGVQPKNLGQVIHHQEEQWANREEFKRVFYVATTRAADMLLLSGAFEDKDIGKSPWMQLLRRKFDLKTGLPVGDPYLGQVAKPGMNREEIPDIKVWQEAPKVTANQLKSERTLPLSAFRETLLEAEPAPLPELIQPVPPDHSGRKVFSVSELEQVIESFSAPVPLPAPSGEESAGEHASQTGDLIHQILQFTDFSAPQENNLKSLQQKVNLASEQLGIRLPEPIQKRAIRLLETFFHSEIPAELSRARQLSREIDFLLEWSYEGQEQPAMISGQIDCLYQAESGSWHLLDYKTGVQTDPAWLLKHYQTQLTIYALAVERLFGSVPESIELIHLGQQTKRIPYQLYPETVEQIKERLTAAINRIRRGAISSSETLQP